MCELEKFLKLDVTGKEEGVTNEVAIPYWIDHAYLYPKLAQVAIRLFSIPASSSDIERLFSLTKDTTNGERSNTRAGLLKNLTHIYNESCIEKKSKR